MPDPINDQLDLEQEGQLQEGQLEGGEEGGEEQPMFLRDYDEDTAYDILTRAREMPDAVNAMESRMQGTLAELQKRFDAYEAGLPTQGSLNVEKLTKVLEGYDPKLAELLGPALQEAFQVNALDKTTLNPHLQPMQEELREYFGQQLVLAAYSPEAIAEIVPPVQNGRFEPQGQRHEDFMNWYSKQGYQTQQSLLSFGAPYVQALRKFEAWEKKLNEDRAEKAGEATQRLKNGQTPSSRSRTPTAPKPKTAEEMFADGFNEAFEEVKR